MGLTPAEPNKTTTQNTKMHQPKPDPFLTLKIKRVRPGSHILVDEDTTKTIYTLDKSHTRDTLHVFRASPSGDVPVGNVKFHTFSKNTDLKIGSTQGTMAFKNIFSSKSVVRGGPFSGEWRRAWFIQRLTLVDDKERMLAEIQGKCGSWSTVGSLVIELPMEQEAIDWVVVTGMAKIELQYKELRRNSLIGGPLGGAAAAC